MKSTHTEGRQMEARFTPGPWNLCSPMNPDRAYGIEAHDDAEGPDGDATQCIAEICDGPPEVARADARLIAAAPDLYAACDELVKAFDGNTDCTDILDLIAKGPIRAALAKARGENGGGQ